MNRRRFIQKSLLFTGTIALSLKSSWLFAKKRATAISGKVIADGKPLAGVLISDGFSFVKTASDGTYTLAPGAKAEFVYLTVPAGYEFPVDNYGQGLFYHPITNKDNFDFKLNKLKADDTKHSFLIWADPQVKNARDVEQMATVSAPDVKRLVKKLGGSELVHGICVGDIVWDNHALFPEYSKAVSKMGIPFFQCLGNHDQDYRRGGDETSDKTFKEHFGPTYYSFNRGKAHYVVLDDVRYLGVERTYDGYISDDQLKWLEQDLKFVPEDHLVVINVHIPIHNSVKNNNDLYALLKRFRNVHIMSGHTHYNRNVITNGIFEHNHGTVCGAWWTAPICEDGTPNGYGVYHVDGIDLKWYYKSTGFEQENQLSVTSETLTRQKRVIANVWNYDPDWKVEYLADGVAMGAMENQKGYDPLAVELFSGPDLPKGRSFPEPRKTEHIFVAHLKPDVQRVKVVATDRFGSKYESEIKV